MDEALALPKFDIVESFEKKYCKGKISVGEFVSQAGEDSIRTHISATVQFPSLIPFINLKKDGKMTLFITKKKDIERLRDTFAELVEELDKALLLDTKENN